MKYGRDIPLENHIYLRIVEKKDMDLLYEWANDSLVRRNSFQTEGIPYDDHVAWFNQVLIDDNILLYFLMDNNTPVGQIRLTINGDEAEIGYSIAKEFRGKGYGHQILQLALEKVKKEHCEIRKLVAKVKPENMVSNRLFIDEGYMLDYCCYTYDLSV